MDFAKEETHICESSRNALSNRSADILEDPLSEHTSRVFQPNLETICVRHVFDTASALATHYVLFLYRICGQVIVSRETKVYCVGIARSAAVAASNATHRDSVWKTFAVTDSFGVSSASTPNSGAGKSPDDIPAAKR